MRVLPIRGIEKVTVAAVTKRIWLTNPRLLIFGIGVIGLHVFQEVFLGQNALGAFVANLLQVVCAALAVVACLRAARKGIGFTRPFWVLVGLSFVVWIAADAGWIYYESFLRVSPARDSIFHFFVDCRALLLAMALLLDPEEGESGYPANAAWALDLCQLFIIFTLIYLGWYQAASHAQSRELSLVRSDQIELGENVSSTQGRDSETVSIASYRLTSIAHWDMPDRLSRVAPWHRSTNWQLAGSVLVYDVPDDCSVGDAVGVPPESDPRRTERSPLPQHAAGECVLCRRAADRAYSSEGVRLRLATDKLPVTRSLHPLLCSTFNVGRVPRDRNPTADCALLTERWRRVRLASAL